MYHPLALAARIRHILNIHSTAHEQNGCITRKKAPHTATSYSVAHSSPALAIGICIRDICNRHSTAQSKPRKTLKVSAPSFIFKVDHPSLAALLSARIRQIDSRHRISHEQNVINIADIALHTSFSRWITGFCTRKPRSYPPYLQQTQLCTSTALKITKRKCRILQPRSGSPVSSTRIFRLLCTLHIRNRHSTVHSQRRGIPANYLPHPLRSQCLIGLSH